MILLSASDANLIVGWLFLWLVVFGPLCGFIYKSRGGEFQTGYLIGAVLGILGVLIVSFKKVSRMSPTLTQRATIRPCPACKNGMPRALDRCSKCGTASEPWIFHEGRWWYRNAAGESFWLDEQKQAWVRYEG